MPGPEERGGRGAGGSGEAQAQGQPRDSAMAPMQPSLGPPRDEPRVFGLDKFNGDNFAEWSFKMENIFDHYDLLEVMEGTEKRPENDPEKSPWVRKSAQGYLLLGQVLGSSQIRHIKPFQREPEKGPKPWAALKGVHAPATAAVAVVLERQMAALRIEEDEAVEEGVQKYFDLLTRLEGADLNYSELQKKNKLLALLPESWSSLIINLNRDLPHLSLEDVKRAILQEDFHRRELASADGAGAASIGRGRAARAGGPTASTCPGGAGAAVPGGPAEAAGVGPTGGSTGASGGTGAAGSAGPGAAGATGVGDAGGVGAGGSAGAGTSEGAGAGGATGVGAPAGSPGAVPAGSGGALRPRPYFVPLLEQVLGLPPSPGPAPPLESPQPVQSQSLFQPVSPLPAPSPYTGPTGGLAERHELRWLTYLLTDLGEQPRSPPVLYVDNKAMLALCREHRLEHRTKHIALRYSLARELQQRGQLRLAYVASEANTADIFTKALAPGDHQRFCTLLALVPTWPHLLTS
ncbi:unnamed protein product [Closterium sp. NIES-53]